ncbi:MAG: RagB/SusD family nutrient uptake outer membrane protein [Algibacter sp.]
MKNIKIYFTGISVLIIGILISCNESDIELTNPNQLSTETYFKSSAQLESSVTAAYAYLQEVGNYARYQFYINDNIAGENYAAGNLEADKVQMINRDIDEANNGNNQYWDHNYKGIGRCNFVIDSESSFENIDATEITQRLGEIRFLRALYYFNIVTKYGEVPLVLSSETVAGGRPKSSITDIYAAIVTDLQFATTNLPAKGTQEVGRATSGAAWALLGKVLLQNDDASGAKTALANVTGYSLVDNYIDNFTVSGEHNDESIFEIHYDESTGAGDSWNQDGLGNSETSFRAQEYSGWYNVKPSQTLLDEFEDGDTRYSDTFYSINDNDNGTMTNIYNKGTTTFTSGTIGPDDNPAWRKYQNLDNRAAETTESGINARVIRYADVLLMKAEAEIRSGGTESVALGYLNEVRNRASVSMPAISVSGAPAILDAIKHERWVELAGEQSRYLDLQRFDGFTYLMPIPNIELQANTNL